MENQNALTNRDRLESARHHENAQETVNSFETMDLSLLLPNHSKSNAAPPANRRRATPPDNTPSVSVAKPTKQTAQQKKLQPRTVPVIQIQTDVPTENNPTSSKRGRRGIPSWLTSLLLHLSLVTSLALVSVSGGGRKMIDLVAASEASVQLVNPAQVELELETPEVEAITSEFDVFDQELTESEDLSVIMEDSLLETTADSSNDAMFESLASRGNSDLELPQRAAGGGANFFGVDGHGSKFIFVVDCSGSMKEFGRWQQAKRELKNSINGLGDSQQFLIMLYNNGFVAMNNSLELVPSTAKERRKALRWLNRNKPASWTFCAEALEQALALKPDAVFLLSDGDFDDVTDVFIVLDQMNDKTQLQRLNRRQTPIHTVALGSHDGTSTMKQIAEENSGVFKLVE